MAEMRDKAKDAIDNAADRAKGGIDNAANRERWLAVLKRMQREKVPAGLDQSFYLP